MNSRRDVNRAAAVQAKVEGLVSEMDEISGIGIGRSSEGYTIRVLTTGPAAHVQLPAEIDGFPICVETIGVIRPQGH
jgi:hypothetical protein